MMNMKTYIYNKVLCTLCSVLFLASCTQEESILPAATDDVLAMMPADTPVGIKAELKDESGKMTDESGSTRTTATWIEENLSSSISHLSTRSEAATYYAYHEIHTDKEVFFSMEMPGASDAEKTQLYPMDGGDYVNIPLNTLATTEPFATLRLKDFNLTEGNDRTVSRWTVLNATYNGLDNLWGWARLTADANGQPVLDYGEMKRANAKVTIVVVDESGTAVDVADGNVTATLSLPQTISEVIYTPEGETDGERFVIYLDGIITLAEDEAINTDHIGIATYPFDTENKYFPLDGMVTAEDNTYYYGEKANTLAAIVPATATHTTEDIYNFTPIANPTFTDDDKLTIEVTEDPDGDTGPQTTGTYSLKLSDVKLSDGSALTSLKSGEHYTLTVTLRHNTLVSATATIGAWNEASASATLGGDNAKLPDNNSTNE